MSSVRYLQNIGVAYQDIKMLDANQQLQYLAEIYLAHLKKFPYHNFELRTISREHPVARTSLTFFTKWDEGIHGGYCYQSVHTLFHVLAELDFNVSRGLGRVHAGLAINSKALLSLPDTHVFIVANIQDQQYLLDPGLSPSCPVAPLPIQPDGSLTEITQRNRLYRFRKHDEDTFVLERKIGEKWNPLFQTNLVMVKEKDIQFSMLKLERFPKKLGIRDTILIIGIVTDTGSKSLFWSETSNGFAYAIENGSQYSKEVIQDPFKISCLLNTEFNIKHISTLDIESYCRKQKMPNPKQPWTVEFPLDNSELQKLKANI